MRSYRPGDTHGDTRWRHRYADGAAWPYSAASPYRLMLWPPSATIVSPVRKAMFSVNRAATSRAISAGSRSEEHTSELQSLMRISYAVFCLKNKHKQHKQNTYL